MRTIKVTALFLGVFLVNLFLASQVFAADGDIGKIENLAKEIANLLALVGTPVAIIFIIVGGYKYATSAGNPEALEQAKKTILHACIGLAIILLANVLANIVNQLAGKVK